MDHDNGHDQHDGQGEHSASESLALSPAEQWDQTNEEAREKLSQLASTVTQREWLLITTKLDRTRQQIGTDNGLTLLAMAWVKGKREHGGASWDRLLDMTDEQLEAVLDFAHGERPEEEAGTPS